MPDGLSRDGPRTGAFTILLIPGAIVKIWLILPAFVPSIAPF